MKGCALGLTLKVRVFGTRKWPIHYFYINHDAPCLPSKVLHTVFIPWALIKFLDLESGRLFEAGRLLNFHHFQQVKYVYFATKQ